MGRKGEKSTERPILGKVTVLSCKEAADDDGKADLSDPIRLLGFIFLGGPPPAHPYPNCGEDPGA